MLKFMATINKKYGETYIATATPNTGYRFVRWTGTGVSTTDNPATLTCVGDNTLEAIFERLQYTVAVGVSPATSGTIVFDPQPASENVIRYTSATAATSDWISANTDTTKNTYNSSTGQGVLYVKPGVYALGSPADTVYEDRAKPFGSTAITSLDLTDFTYTPTTRSINDPIIGPAAFTGDTSLTSVVIGPNVKWIGEDAFRGCTNLQSVEIQGDTSIGAYAFYLCSHLSSLNITGSVTSISEGAFNSCSALTSVTLPAGLKFICNEAFADTGLTSVTLPEGLEYIGTVVFPSTLSSLTIPSTVGFNDTFAQTTIFKSYAPPLMTLGSNGGDIQVPSNAVNVWQSYTFNGGLTGAQLFNSITSNGTTATVTTVPVYFNKEAPEWDSIYTQNLYPWGWGMNCEHQDWAEAEYNSLGGGGVTMFYTAENDHEMDSVRASTNRYFNNYLTLSPSAQLVEDWGEGDVVEEELYAAGDYTTVTPGSVVYYMAFKNGDISTIAQYVPTENDLACWQASNPWDTSECPEEGGDEPEQETCPLCGEPLDMGTGCCTNTECENYCEPPEPEPEEEPEE